jgi:hypothetical protein
VVQATSLPVQIGSGSLTTRKCRLGRSLALPVSALSRTATRYTLKKIDLKELPRK